MKTVDKVTIIVAVAVMFFGVFVGFQAISREKNKREAVAAKAIESRLSLSEHRFPDQPYVTAYVITDSLNGREYLVVKSSNGTSITPIIK